MYNEDRYHTTSWDGREVQRQMQPDGSSRQQDPFHPAPAKKKNKKKKRTNPFLGFILWVAIVAATSAICAGVGWMLANDFAALNKTYREVDFEVPEEWVSEVAMEEQETGEKKEVTHYDMTAVSKALKKAGLIEYDWFFRLFCRFYHATPKLPRAPSR